MSEVSDYTGLITSQHADKPKFLAVVGLNVSVQVQVQALLASMIPLFDLDQAVGDQLDKIGQWVGITRAVSIPAAGIFFTFDDATTDGWDYGSWQPPVAPFTITSLPDDAFKTLIRAKIAANAWDGTTTGAYNIWAAVFPNTRILIQDYQSMSFALVLVGGIIDSLTLALLTEGYIPLKPSGVRIAAYFVSVDTNPVFSWDASSTDLGGWDTSSWVREIPAST